MNKPKIDYPCDWTYTIIGLDEALIRSAVSEVFASKAHDLDFSRKSKKGKYVSLVVTAKVEDEQERVNTFNSLANHPSIKLVL